MTVAPPQGESSSSSRRYVVSIRMAGLGDRIVSLGGAWRFARATGRSLVVDWRFGEITPDTSKNAFPLCFEPISDLAGVDLLACEHVETRSLPRPRFPESWNADALLALPFLRPAATSGADREAAVRLARQGTDVPAATIVFDGCLNDGLADLDQARTFLAALRPARSIRDRVEEFRRGHMAGRRMIGVHVRHGNGGDILAHTRYWTTFATAITRCAEAVRHAQQLVGSEAAVLLCTDSIEVRDAFARLVPGVVTRAKSFRAPGKGDLHTGPGAWEHRDDALIEMLLLAECDVLIRYPPGSFFSFWAAAMLSVNDRGLRTIYDLHRPWDAGDPLSPAVIVRGR